MSDDSVLAPVGGQWPMLVVERDRRGGWRTPEFEVDLRRLERTLPHSRETAMPTVRSRKERGEKVARLLRGAMAKACGVAVDRVELRVRQDMADPLGRTLVTLTATPSVAPRGPELASGPVLDV